MDELELLRRFRSDVPAPGAERAEAVRTDFLERLHSSGPGRPPRPGRGGRGWTIALAVVVVGLLVAVALPSVLPILGPGGAEPAAAAVLHEAADVAARRPALAAPGSGQFVYTKSENAYLNGWPVAGSESRSFWALMPQIREIWIGPDGSGRILETTGRPTFLSNHDREAWLAAGSPTLGADKTTDDSYPAAQLHFLDLSNLPTDPDTLIAVIERRKIIGGPPGDAETFTIIGDLLRETYAPPALRSALFEVASELSGVELVGRVNDAAGRPGVAVAYTHSGRRHELIFDPRTSQLLGERYVLVDPAEAELHADPGTVIGYAAYLESGVVDSTNARP